MNKLRLILYKLGLLKCKKIHRSFLYLDNFRYSYPFGRKLSDNQEQQIYLDDNVFRKDNVYEFIIKKENIKIKPFWNSKVPKEYFYTSGMLYSNEKFLHGSFEADVFIPSGYGLWSAFWLQGENDEGIREIDIFEYYGKEKEFTYSIHYGKSYLDKERNTEGIRLSSLENTWNTFRLDWHPNEDLKFYINDKLVGVMNGEPFDIPMNLIINCAVQNDIDDKLDNTLPTIMMVKNIRHYGIH